MAEELKGTKLMNEIINTNLANISDFVQIKDEEVYTTSRIVAEKFGKEHKNVIQSIEELNKTMSQPIENINELKNQPVKNAYFIADSYLDAKGENRKQYLITEKGAMLLIMGFTGEKAFAIKTKFIDEFARMKNIINNPAQVISETGSLDALVAFGMANQRYVNAMIVAKQELDKQKQLTTTVFSALNEVKDDFKQLRQDYHTIVHDRSVTYTTTEVAKDLGLRSAVALNKWLQEQGIIYKHYSNVKTKKYSWMVCADYVGLASIKVVAKDGKQYKTLRWTNDGKVFIVNLYQKSLDYLLI